MRSILHRGYSYAWFQYISNYEDRIEPIKGHKTDVLADHGDYPPCPTNWEIGPGYPYHERNRKP